MMRKGTSRRPEHERSTDTPSHDGCLQVKMDAPAGLQRPSEGNPSRHDSRPLIGPQLDISIICRGGQPLVLLQIPALAPLGDLVTIPARALHQHGQTPLHGRRWIRCTPGRPDGTLCDDATPWPSHTLMTKRLAVSLAGSTRELASHEQGLDCHALVPIHGCPGVGASFSSKSAAAPTHK